MLVSCHIPKTAGSSFGEALRDIFDQRFFWDVSNQTIISAMYAKNHVPIESVPVRWLNRYKPPSLRGIGCIHGHFPLRKFISLAFDRTNCFVVWLREPLQWRISLYHYWKTCYPHPFDKYINRMFDENWDVERFCMEPTFDNYQSRYLAWFPRQRLNFIAVQENYTTDLSYLSRNVLHCDLNLYRKNERKNPDGVADGNFGGTFLQRYQSNNRADYRMYWNARRVSDARASEAGFGVTEDAILSLPPRSRAG